MFVFSDCITLPRRLQARKRERCPKQRSRFRRKYPPRPSHAAGSCGLHFCGRYSAGSTLSPFFDALQTQAFLQRYKTEGPGSIVWTKLDEAVSFGSIVNVACAAGLPVSALSYGAELKESLAPATEPLVWRLIFKRQLPGQAA